MFCESYFIFAVGNVPTIWKDMYSPTCYTTKTADPVCLQGTTAIPFVPVAGIIVGMVTFGLASDALGRRWGSRLTVSLMLIGSILLTIANGTSLAGQFVMFNIGMFIFALGVGGEYPMAASSASERSETEKLPRGRTVAFTFANQGWGNLTNTWVILFMLAVTGTGGCNTTWSSNTTLVNDGSGNTYQQEYCNLYQMEVAWRVSFGLGIPFVAGLWVYRWFILSESIMWVDRQQTKYSTEEKEALRIKRLQNTRLLFGRKYLPRLIGAAGGWFFWDVAFYGNKLFQGTIIASIVGGNKNSVTLLLNFEYTLLNSFVALIGYYFAAFTIDKKWMGRVRMQNMGFMIDAILFLACGYDYSDLSKNKLQAFQAMYLLSSFFGQFGPNVTTWILPVELFPTDVRAQAHGFSAASGKLGALLATLMFGYGNNGGVMTSDQIFIISGYFVLAGWVCTVLFVPDITNIPLAEIERRWSMDRRAANGEVGGETQVASKA
jgi:MFS family permease